MLRRFSSILTVFLILVSAEAAVSQTGDLSGYWNIRYEDSRYGSGEGQAYLSPEGRVVGVYDIGGRQQLFNLNDVEVSAGRVSGRYWPYFQTVRRRGSFLERLRCNLGIW